MLYKVEVKTLKKTEIYEYEGNLSLGENVVVDTDYGKQLGKVLTKIDLDKTVEHFNIIRIATKQDIDETIKQEKQEQSRKKIVKKMVKERALEMKILYIYECLDDNKLTILFSAENRVDFRELVRALASEFRARIELRQIGLRDEAQIIGGLGPCGMPCCCKHRLQCFPHTTIKMAKTQNLSLNPTSISGICGRLMCCLSFENETYAKLLEKMPKTGSEVQTPQGKGVIIYGNILEEKVTVKIAKSNGDFETEEFKLDQITKLNINADKVVEDLKQKDTNKN
ncbi:MAG: regulatory iron-sulfur-containing complex subunit RicT [Clostridia bacterium]